MADMTFDDILEAAAKLHPSEKQRLADALRSDTLRDEIIMETEGLRQSGAFAKAQSLYGKYKRPDMPNVTAVEMDEHLEQIGTEWEAELDEFNRDND